MTRKLLLEHTIGDNNFVEFNTSQFGNGIYLVALKNNGIIRNSKRIVIQK